MTHPPARIAAQLLTDVGLASAFGGATNWPVYVGDEPDTPDEVVTVYDTDGPTFGRLMVTGEVTGHDGLQFRVRSVTYAGGRRKADQIVETLSEDVYQRVVSVGSETYLVQTVNGLDSVLSLGRDKPGSRRHLFTVNATLVVRQLTPE